MIISHCSLRTVLELLIVVELHCQHTLIILDDIIVRHWVEKWAHLRDGVKKSKWKFKMAFAIRGPTPPLNGKISRHFFTPLFFFCN